MVQSVVGPAVTATARPLGIGAFAPDTDAVNTNPVSAPYVEVPVTENAVTVAESGSTVRPAGASPLEPTRLAVPAYEALTWYGPPAGSEVFPMLQLDAGSVTVHVAELPPDPTETVTAPLLTRALLAVRTATANVAADSAPYVTVVGETVMLVVVEPCPTLSWRGADVAVYPSESVTRNTSPRVAPTVVGVPVISPVPVLSDAHAGSGGEPGASAQVYPPPPPTAASDAEYPAPTLPGGRSSLVTPRVVADADCGSDCQLSPIRATIEYS
jgi:hypothetical protein